MFLFLILNLINGGPFNKAIGPGKKSKIKKRRPTIIPESRVHNQMNKDEIKKELWLLYV